MSDLMPFIIAGLTLGAVYGLAGVGLVLTYKTSGVFNFAHGAMATISAYAFYVLNVEQGLSWQLSAAIVILVLGPVTGLLMELLARKIQTASLAFQVASTVGLSLSIAAGARLYFGDELRQVPPFLDFGSTTIFGASVGTADMITLALAVITTVALSIYFQRALGGIAMRAVVDNPELLDIVGTNPARTRRMAWVIGGTLVSACGVLFAPILPLDPVQLTLLVVAAFGAAAVGAFTNLPMTFVGGIFLGLLASLWAKWFPDGELAGLPPALPFIVLFLVILVFPKRYLSARSGFVPRRQAVWTTPGSFQLGSGAVMIVFLAVVPTFAGLHLVAWTTALATAIVFLSLSLLVRTSGQVSLAHVAFMAIGAAGFSRLTVDAGMPWLLALLVIGLIAIPVGALLAIPASRLGGLYLALATFGFGLLMQVAFYTRGFLFGDDFNGLIAPRPTWFSFETDEGYYYVVLIFAVLFSVATVALVRGRLGRLLRAMADSPTALETSGTKATVSRMIVFCLSAFMAAIGGALAGVAQTNVSSVSYPPLLSLTFFVLVVIIPGGAPWNSLVAAASMVLIPSYVDDSTVSLWLQALIGVGAVLTVAMPASASEAPPALRAFMDRTFRRSTRRGRKPAEIVARPKVAPVELTVTDLTVRFGGFTAIDSFSLVAATGRITGLIGPNGAGKTTTFNACSGLVRPSSGTVRLGDSDLTRRGASLRARRGIGRTFQRMELLESQTVRENIAIGYEGGLAGANPFAHVLGSPATGRRLASRVEEAMALCDITSLADTPVQSLSTGQRRLVELARCVAGDFSILLLDEPSSGLDRAETQRFGEIVRHLVESRGVGILLVEHDMSLVLEICDTVAVLDFGKHLFTGTPAEAVADPHVQAAYLGTNDETVNQLAKGEPITAGDAR
jgi:ABC-type branched-subunit amino acid transport system ATPase component/branched-subunit amino acid ABC-type transport system permease component